jgi:dGTPase
LVSIREKAQDRVKQMYQAYCDKPDFFPQKYRERAEKIGVRRMAVEYIAGMTDHFCEETFRTMFP